MESFPPTPVTNYGIQLLEEGFEPHITYISPDGDLAFYLNGGLAPWPGVTEGVALADGMEGLHPTFNHLDHKGARTAGVSWAGTVYDPAEIKMEVTATARTPEGLRNVIRKWIAAWDPEKTGTLSWVTPDGGEWWCQPRLMRPPPEKLARSMARSTKQNFTWIIRNDDAFWRSHDSVSQYQVPFLQASDGFDVNYTNDLGPNWVQFYLGPGVGKCVAIDQRAQWIRSGYVSNNVINRWNGKNELQTVIVNGSPTTWRLSYNGQNSASITHPATAATVQTRLQAMPNIGVNNATVSGPDGGPYAVTFTGTLAKKDVPQMTATVLTGGTNPFITVAKTQDGAPAVTATDNQIVHFRLSNFYKWPWPTNSRLDLWGRLSADGQNGIRCRIAQDSVIISRFVSGVETQLYYRPLFLPPLNGEEWTLVLGTSTNGRTYKVMRSGFQILTVTESGTGLSNKGASYRYSGFGMAAGTGTGGDAGVNQDVPPTLFDWGAGDNVAIETEGHLELTNLGDQEGYPDIVVYGPGTFIFGDGPDRAPTIEFGPLAAGQIALIKTHPSMRGVYDLTAETPEQDLPGFQSFIKSLFSFAFNANIPPLMGWFQSLFGISPPQGSLYSLLKGRWSRGIPARGLGLPETHQISLKIKDATVDTRVVAALTPVRRWPE